MDPSFEPRLRRLERLLAEHATPAPDGWARRTDARGSVFLDDAVCQSNVDRVRAWPRLPRAELALLFPRGSSQHVPIDGVPITKDDVRLARANNKELAMEVAQLAHVVVAVRLVHDAAVVPDHHFAHDPLVAVFVFRLRRVGDELADERDRFLVLHADDRIHAHRIEKQRLAISRAGRLAILELVQAQIDRLPVLYRQHDETQQGFFLQVFEAMRQAQHQGGVMIAGDIVLDLIDQDAGLVRPPMLGQVRHQPPDT